MRLDDDDPTLEQYQTLREMTRDFAGLRIIEGHRPSNLNTSINQMAKLAAGFKSKFLWVMNDDATIETDGWDTLLKELYIEEMTRQDQIYYLRTADNSIDRGGEYASFPLLTLEAHNALGYFMSEQFVGLGGDVHLHRVFSSVGRVLDFSVVELDHHAHSTLQGVNSPDETAASMRQNSWSNWIDPFTAPIDEDVARVKEHLK